MPRYILNFIILCALALGMVSCRSSRSAAPSRSGDPVSISKPLDVNRSKLISDAKKLIGTPYKYGSYNPNNGLDCSGMFYYLFWVKRNIKVPRSSRDYTNEGEEIKLKKAIPGDIILFTGSNNKSRVVGHMGLITKVDGENVSFVHSSTSKGVIISTLSGYWKDHYIKTIRILQ